VNLDRGWSSGMSIAREVYEQAGVRIEERLLPNYVAPKTADAAA
jgi:hypothetical protein